MQLLRRPESIRLDMPSGCALPIPGHEVHQEPSMKRYLRAETIPSTLSLPFAVRCGSSTGPRASSLLAALGGGAQP
jgi:hypothetical protein